MAKLGPDNNFTAHIYIYTHRRERDRERERERERHTHTHTPLQEPLGVLASALGASRQASTSVQESQEEAEGDNWVEGEVNGSGLVTYYFLNLDTSNPIFQRAMPSWRRFLCLDIEPSVESPLQEHGKATLSYEHSKRNPVFNCMFPFKKRLGKHPLIKDLLFSMNLLPDISRDPRAWRPRNPSLRPDPSQVKGQQPGSGRKEVSWPCTAHNGFGNPLTIYRGLLGPPGPKPRKVSKKSPGAGGPGPPRESGKGLEKVFSGLFPDSRDLFGTFSRLSGGPGARGPRRLFWDFFGVSGPEGPRDPCKWSTGSQQWLARWCNFPFPSRTCKRCWQKGAFLICSQEVFDKFKAGPRTHTHRHTHTHTQIKANSSKFLEVGGGQLSPWCCLLYLVAPRLPPLLQNTFRNAPITLSLHGALRRGLPFHRSRIGWSRMSGRRTSGTFSQVWEFRFLPSFPSLVRRNCTSKMSGKQPGSAGHSSTRHPRPPKRSLRDIEIQNRAVKRAVEKLEGDRTASSAGKWVVAKLQGDKSASQSSIELCDPWISGPLRVSWSQGIAVYRAMPPRNVLLHILSCSLQWVPPEMSCLLMVWRYRGVSQT